MLLQPSEEAMIVHVEGYRNLLGSLEGGLALAREYLGQVTNGDVGIEGDGA
jgi:hypothetical protein